MLHSLRNRFRYRFQEGSVVVSVSEGRSRVTISDIAKRAGVSKATVSRVLNNKPDVDEATRQRILATIQEAGFNRNAVAVGLAKGRSNLIGLLAPSLSGPYSLEEK